MINGVCDQIVELNCRDVFTCFDHDAGKLATWNGPAIANTLESFDIPWSDRGGGDENDCVAGFTQGRAGNFDYFGAAVSGE
jgi:hypothetical protein